MTGYTDVTPRATRDLSLDGCVCGNVPTSDGFYPVVLRDGKAIEVKPTESEWPDYLYACADCARIWRQEDCIRFSCDECFQVSEFIPKD